MRVTDIIIKKRNGETLTASEINALISAYTQDEVPDYQMAAWLMAVFFRGMTVEETAALTMAMANSGARLDLSQVPGIKIDKHSTGGVADTTTLVIAPLVAAAGIPVAKMSGRGLGFTGGTIDKLEAIPGFHPMLTKDEFISNLQQHGLAVTGQTIDLAPADGKIYALRDVTGTVESIPLIAASIMSKKIAGGADKILLDVKVGSGAFMKTLADAIKLAEIMVHVGNLIGRETVAVLTSMDEPLGRAVGNSLEVQEAIDILKGGGSDKLRHVCLTLAAQMLVMGRAASNVADGYSKAAHILDSGLALAKFAEFLTAQGGNKEIIITPQLLPQAKFTLPVASKRAGFVQSFNTAMIGHCALLLGAGREHKGQSVDLAAGLMLHCAVGDAIEENQVLVTLYTNKCDKVAEVCELVHKAIIIGEHRQIKGPLILGIVDKEGFKQQVD